MKAVYGISVLKLITPNWSIALPAMTLNSLVPGNIRHSARNTNHFSALNYFLLRWC